MNTFPEIFDDNHWLIQIKGRKEGPTTAILGAIHGNEKIGIDVLRKIKNLGIDAGTVYLVGGNPRAYTQHKRFIDYNLNRVFGDDNEFENIKNSYERTRAKLIQEVLDQCDAVLDLHQSHSDHNFVVCEAGSDDVARMLDARRIIHSLDAGCTDKYMDDRGKIGVCFEAGKIGDIRPEKNIEMGFQQAKKFLQEVGNRKNRFKWLWNFLKLFQRETPIFQTFFVYRTKENFQLNPEIRAFQKLKKGQFIGFDGNRKIICPSAWRGATILFPKDEKIKDQEAFSVARKI